jgi:hypothetical protein
MDSFSELKSLCLNKHLSDITLIVDGIQIPAHKLILSAKSKVFEAMFFTDMIESKAKEIQIKETSIEAFKEMLKFVYTESFDFDKESPDYEMVFNVFEIAHRFQFERLIDVIKTLMIEMLTNTSVSNIYSFLTFTLRTFKEWVSTDMKKIDLNQSLKATFDSFAAIYEFAILYELDELVIACHQFIAKPQNAYIIIGQQLFLCNSLEAMYNLLKVMLNSSVTQSLIIYCLQSIRELRPDSDLKRFQKLINLNNCSVDEIIALQTIKIFDDQILWSMISTKFERLNRENEIKSMRISELISSNHTLKEDIKDLSLKKQDLYENYFRLKQMFAPFMRGQSNVLINEFHYTRNHFPRIKPKPVSEVKFPF